MLDLPRGLSLVGQYHLREAYRRHLKEMLSPPSWFLSLWRKSESALSSSWVTKLLTMSLRKEEEIHFSCLYLPHYSGSKKPAGWKKKKKRDEILRSLKWTLSGPCLVLWMLFIKKCMHKTNDKVYSCQRTTCNKNIFNLIPARGEHYWEFGDQSDAK